MAQFKSLLLEELTDDNVAREYLRACIEDDMPEEFWYHSEMSKQKT